MNRPLQGEQAQMEVLIFENSQTADAFAARIIARSIRENPFLVLGLATGRTMQPVYAHLVRMHREDGLDFSRVRTFNLDEYVGIPPDHPQSYRTFMNEHLFNHINIPLENTHVLNGMAPDIPAECEAFEERIRACGGIDLQLLGIGVSGHIGFNEPASSLASRTRIKTLTRATIRQNAVFFGSEEAVPRHVLTMGIGTIMEARRCLVVVTGAEKAAVVAKAIEGPVSAMVTASALQMHPHVTVVLDREAARDLTMRSYYEWVFANLPDWEKQRYDL